MAGKKQPAVSNEQIIAALLNSGSLAQAAEATGIAPRTLYDRMGTREFRAAYSAAKSDLVRQAVATLKQPGGGCERGNGDNERHGQPGGDAPTGRKDDY